MPSALAYSDMVHEYILGEVEKGRMIAPLARELWDGCQISRIGVIPNGHTPGRWRLITDLSSPDNASVN